MNIPDKPARAAVLVFLCVFAFLWWTSAAHLSLDYNDEGIYFDGALRMLHGQMPYRDFFALAGPGTFAIIAGALRMFGISLAAARATVVFDIALMAACLFWMVWNLSGRLAAIPTTIAFVAFDTAGPTTVVVNHRWDSAAWAILATTLIFAAIPSPKKERAGMLPIALAGFAAGIAAWCTPNVALVAVALALCIRKRLAPFAAGIALAMVPGTLWLASRGALRPMLDSLLWSAANYSGPNRTPYAWVNGGYAPLFQGSSGVQAVVIFAVMIFFTLPATLPFVSAIWIAKRPEIRIVVLLSSGAALLLSTYPRWDLMHLTQIAAPFYALTAALVAGSRVRVPIALATLMIALTYLSTPIKQRMGEVSRATSLGRLHGDPADFELLREIQSRVARSDSLFVFPYRPSLYFMTGARNPTRYSFLQPGMFPEKDEWTALSELQADPPVWVYYTDLPESAYLRIWPSSNRARLRLRHIEDFLKEN
ncbi:MAG TPA: hypothetical protein VK419_05530, partial [Bryobacteraceae bacterium]|nr:hypothetical protein [Bryobacteraceae bacterium]